MSDNKAPAHRADQGLLAIWNAVDADAREYADWITREHMPERMQVPGVACGRRYTAVDGGPQPYLNLYEADNPGLFYGTAYRTMVENPTEWTRRMMPHLTRFSRAVLRRVFHRGSGVGGALLSVRLAAGTMAEPFAAACERWWQDEALAARICAMHGALTVDGEEWQTEERRLRGTLGRAEADFSHLLLLETVHVDDLVPLADRVRQWLAPMHTGQADLTLGAYALSYVLRNEPDGC